MKKSIIIGLTALIVVASLGIGYAFAGGEHDGHKFKPDETYHHILNLQDQVSNLTSQVENLTALVESYHPPEPELTFDITFSKVNESSFVGGDFHVGDDLYMYPTVSIPIEEGVIRFWTKANPIFNSQGDVYSSERSGMVQMDESGIIPQFSFWFGTEEIGRTYVWWIYAEHRHYSEEGNESSFLYSDIYWLDFKYISYVV